MVSESCGSVTVSSSCSMAITYTWADFDSPTGTVSNTSSRGSIPSASVTSPWIDQLNGRIQRIIGVDGSGLAKRSAAGESRPFERHCA